MWSELIDDWNRFDPKCELGEFGVFKEKCIEDDNEEAIKWALIISELPESEDK